MSGYSEMLAQGKKFAEERKEKASPPQRRESVDDLAASLLGDLERNIYQRETPPKTSDGVTHSVTSDAIDGAINDATDGDHPQSNAIVIATDGATGGDHNDAIDSAQNSVTNSVTQNKKTAQKSNDSTPPADAENMDPAYWTENERRVFTAFAQSQDHLFSYPALSTKLGIPPSTIRRIAERFEAAGFILRRRLIKGRVRGVEITLLKTNGATCSVTNGAQNNASSDASKGVTCDAQKNYSKEEIDKIDQDLSIWNTSYTDMQTMWPHVCAIGFTTTHLRQLQQIFAIQRFESATIALSLRYLDWQLEQTGGQLFNPKGEPVSDPVAYWLASMRRNGYYNKPKGYVDPIVAARRLLLEQEREEAEVEKALDEARRQRKAAQSGKKLDGLFAEILNKGEAHPLYAAFLDALPGVLKVQAQSGGLGRLSGPGAKAGVHMALEIVLQQTTD